MNTWTKRGTIIMLAALIIVMGVAVPNKKAEAAMTYNNTSSANLSAIINSNGRLTAHLSVMGINGCTNSIETSLYVEKSTLGIFWSRVDIGYPNNTWYDSTTGYYYSNSFDCNLSSTGTYRVTVTYTVSRTGGTDDTITKTATVNY